MTEREARMLGLISRMHSAWTATSITRQVAFGPSVVHKAVSAESILRYCLQQKGWTRDYKGGILTELQHIELLKDVMGYCESWLNHEAKAFAERYLARALDSVVLPDSSDSPLARSYDEDGGELGGVIRAEGWFKSQTSRFFGRIRQFIREGIVAGVMSLLGPAPLSDDDLAAVDREVEVQLGYLSRFENDVLTVPILPLSGEPIPGVRPITPEGFVARTSSYSTSVYGATQRVGRASSVRAQVRQERRVLGDPATEHCLDCPEIADRGWQTIGTLPDIGTVQCKHRCLCHFEYRFYEDGPLFTRVRPGVYQPTK